MYAKSNGIKQWLTQIMIDFKSSAHLLDIKKIKKKQYNT